MKDINNESLTIAIESLHKLVKEIDEKYGGDVSFMTPASRLSIEEFEALIGWKLPAILKYFLMVESNGLIIGNKRIFSLLDKGQKKTFVDNLQRQNNPETSPWFKQRPHIFDDYLVIGQDGEICFCFSKKYQIDNPSVYICENANSSNGVDFDRLNLDLEGLIRIMIKEEFE